MSPIDNPKAQIIIPARNEGFFLGHTLESIRRTAGYDNYRVVVVDDASEDGCAVGLNERFPDMDLTVIHVGLNDPHGTGVSRNLGLTHFVKDSEADAVTLTCDGHHVFPKNWLADMMAVHKQYPGAFLMAASCGFRSVANVHAEVLHNPSDQEIAGKIAELRKKYKKPILVEKAREEIDAKEPGHLQNLMQKFGVCMVHADGPVQKKPVWRFLVKDSIMAPGKPVGVHYGCRIEYDPGDQHFFTPKWYKAWDTEHPPMLPVAPVDGFMGATYLFPHKLFVERIGGWPWIAGWVHEEPYLSIAAILQGIPILLVRDVITAHSYDRPIKIRPNTHGITLNKQVVTEICFSDMKEVIQRTLFQAPLDPVELERRVGPELRRRREMIQSNRVMTDKEFLYRLGLLHYFDPEHKKLAIERLGVTGVDASELGEIGIENFLKGLKENKHVRWAHALVRTGAGGKLRTTKFVEDRPFDPDTGNRNQGRDTEPLLKEEMHGLILRDLIGEIAADYIYHRTIAGKLPMALQELSALSANIQAIQTYLLNTVNLHFERLYGNDNATEAFVRTIKRLMVENGVDEALFESTLSEEREKLKAELEAKQAEQQAAEPTLRAVEKNESDQSDVVEAGPEPQDEQKVIPISSAGKDDNGQL